MHSTRGYCGSPGTVGTADGYCRVLQVLPADTVDASGYCTVPVGTVGTVTVGYCGYCRVLQNV